jgi:hypothetical protein
MKRAVYAFAALAAVVATRSFAGCASDLSSSTPGHDQCSAQGQCLAGYVCDQATNTCVTTTGTGGVTGTGGGTGGTGGAGGDAGAGGDGGGEGGVTTDAGTDGGGEDGGTDGGTGDGGSGGDGGESGGDGGDGGCGQGLTACGNVCVDEQTDPAHCGSCGNACDPPVSGIATGAPKCNGGTSCDVTCNTTTSLECAVTFGHACVNPLTDPQYCNTCGTHCPGGQTCKSGACVSVCGPKLTLCGTSCVDLDSDPNHCGTCTTACGVLGPMCNARSCDTAITGACGTLTECSITGGLTACADTMTDPTHCGNCTTVCGADQICSGGSCTSYIFASAAWECGNGNSLPTYCQSTGICVGTGVACP